MLRLPMVRVARSVRPRAVILLYHRVSELSSDPQLLAVSRKNFAEQLEVIARAGVPVPLAHLDEALERRWSGKPAIIVTFDDGYADNLHEAKPLLARYGVPATVFVSSGFVKSQRELLHDELEKIFLQPGQLPRALQLVIDDRVLCWDLGTASSYTEREHRDHHGWSVLCAETPTERHRVYRSVFKALFPLCSERRQQCLRQLLEWSDASPFARPSHRPLSEAELVQLQSGGLVEIGGHTVNHPVLSSLPASAQRAEISECKTALEGILRTPVTTFAYPYGARADYNAETVAAVRESGFTFACANVASLVSRATDHWELPRFPVRDWNGTVFQERLRAWSWHL